MRKEKMLMSDLRFKPSLLIKLSCERTLTKTTRKILHTSQLFHKLELLRLESYCQFILSFALVFFGVLGNDILFVTDLLEIIQRDLMRDILDAFECMAGTLEVGNLGCN